MTEILKTIALQLVSEKCFDKYFHGFDFLDGIYQYYFRIFDSVLICKFFVGECFKALLSKSLGYGIVCGSMMVKVPQILKIVNSKSVEGLNLFSIFLEIFVITLNLSYSFVKGFPFSTWGDGSFLAVQTTAIACLIMFYNGSLKTVLAFLVAYIAVCITLMGGTTPVEWLWSAQALNIPIIVVAKLIQIYTNYKNGSTGQLSAVTCAMLFFGSVARIFTSYQETGDSMLILTYLVSSCTNGLIIAQLIYYWSSDKKKNTPTKVGQPKASPKKTKAKKIN